MSTPSGPDNFLALEEELVERLKERLADLMPKLKVLTSSDLAGVTEEQQHTPAVHVIYRGYNVVESPRADGNTARVEQTWLAVVATRNTKAIRSGSAARADAGLISRRVMTALMGFKAPGMSKPLRISDAPEAKFTAGFQYLPLAFVAELAFSN